RMWYAHKQPRAAKNTMYAGRRDQATMYAELQNQNAPKAASFLWPLKITSRSNERTVKEAKTGNHHDQASPRWAPKIRYPHVAGLATASKCFTGTPAQDQTSMFWPLAMLVLTTGKGGSWVNCDNAYGVSTIHSSLRMGRGVAIKYDRALSQGSSRFTNDGR